MPTQTTASGAPLPGAEPFIHNIDSGPAYWWLDILWVLFADANDTGGRFAMMYELMPKGSGPGPHKNTWSDETYYMLHGEIAFLVGDEIRTARQGDFVLVPRDTRHAFRVDSDTASFLDGYSPASLEAAVAELAMPAPARIIPPVGATPLPRMTPAQYRRYGMDPLPGPDPLRPGSHE